MGPPTLLQGKHPLMDAEDNAPTPKAAVEASRSKTVGFQQQGPEDSSVFRRMEKGRSHGTWRALARMEQVGHMGTGALAAWS